MNAEQPFYADESSILLVNPAGGLRRLHTPFLVQVQAACSNLEPGTWLYVERVYPHDQHRLLYKVVGRYYPYRCFRLSAVY